jgi:hypothetical protein
MKRAMFVMCVVSSLTALPSSASPRRHFRPISSATATSLAIKQVTDPTLVPRAFAEARERRLRRTRGVVHASAITDNRFARVLVIPAAGSTPGGGGTLFFRSDVTLINYNSAPQDVVALWWAAGTSNPLATTAGTRLTLPPTQALTITDFVASVFHLQGLGAIVLIPVTGNTFDGTAAVDGLSRIYTKQPGSEGTVSQEFASVDPDSFSAIDEAAALGLRQDANFRTNFGLVNLDEVPHVVHVRFIGERAQSAIDVTVPADGMIQQAMPAGDYGALTIVYDITDAGVNFVTWIAFASSTDNITGDGWVSLASADFDSTGLDDNGF